MAACIDRKDIENGEDQHRTTISAEYQCCVNTGFSIQKSRKADGKNYAIKKNN